MHPICPNCKADGKIEFLVSKSMGNVIKGDSIWPKVKGILLMKSKTSLGGRSKYWYCNKCKKRWKIGAEVLIKKD
jgi:hypothetical protein